MFVRRRRLDREFYNNLHTSHSFIRCIMKNLFTIFDVNFLELFTRNLILAFEKGKNYFQIKSWSEFLINKSGLNFLNKFKKIYL